MSDIKPVSDMKSVDVSVQLPGFVNEIIDTINNRGFEAYAVGGCVRDILSGREPADWDLATSAMPGEIENMFEETDDAGISHGTVAVMYPAFSCESVEKHRVEITTFRSDGGYNDHRHPSAVRFSLSLQEDLSRRDFTVNSMAYHPKTGLIDLFNGLRDLSAGIIRTVGNPKERFTEDALRMLRAVRFSARFGYLIEKETLEGIKDCAHLLVHISAERVRDELTGIIMSNNPARFELLYETGILEYALPEVERSFTTNMGKNILKSVEAIENDYCLRWTMLLKDTGKDSYLTQIPAEIMQRLKFSKKNMKTILHLVEYYNHFLEPTPEGLRIAAAYIGKKNLVNLIKVKTASNIGLSNDEAVQIKKYFEQLKLLYDQMVSENWCTSVKELKINGEDLIKAGYVKGPEIGMVLKHLLSLVLVDTKMNDKEKLIEEAKNCLH